MAPAARRRRALSGRQREQLESLLLEFDRTWQPDALAERVRSLPSDDTSFRHVAVLELVKIDLERQWKSGRQPTVEQYLQQFPELGDAETVPPELLLAEYEVRQQVGAPAALREFQRRFPHASGSLRGLLEQRASSSSRVSPSGQTSQSGHRSATRFEQVATSSTRPQEFGRYRIVKQLGEGGMGSVYLAHDTQLDRRVALKIPKFEAGEDQQIIERFYREARAAARLQNRHICPVHDVGEIAGVHFISMSYVEGRPLAAYIRRKGNQPQRQVAFVVQKLALALQEAHEQGIVHRDLKPANIMIDRKNEPVIMDFGLARRSDKHEDARLTQQGALIGSPAYMSPEQVAGDVERIGPATDIYSLGVILYELLTGRAPFDGPVTVVLGLIMAGQDPPSPVEFRGDLDPRLVEICQRMMARPIEERYGSMQQVADALGGFLRRVATEDSATEPQPSTSQEQPDEPGESLPAVHPPLPKIARPMAGGQFRRSPPTGRCPRRTHLSARMWCVIAGGVAGFLMLLLVLMFALRTPRDTVRVQAKKTRSQKVPAQSSPTSTPEGQALEDHVPGAKAQRPALLKAPFEPALAEARRRAWAEYLGVPAEHDVDLGKGVTLTLALIPPGEFMMGGSAQRVSKSPAHLVRLSKPFYMGRNEVTVSQFGRFVESTDYRTYAEQNPESGMAWDADRGNWHEQRGYTWENPKFPQTDDQPVVLVCWDDAEAFCSWLALEQVETYRLPTEAEWEYSAAAGSNADWYFGDEPKALRQHANLADQALKHRHPTMPGEVTWDDGFAYPAPVCSLEPNAFGLHDVHGNVWEWCRDWFAADYYGRSPTENPPGPATGTRRSIRGGGWNSTPSITTLTWRKGKDVTACVNTLGFRVLAEISQTGETTP